MRRREEKEKKEKGGWEWREGEDGNFCWKQLLERREATEGVDEKEWLKEKEKALKGDNKELLKEQIKMSFPPPLTSAYHHPSSVLGGRGVMKGETS